MVPSHERLGGVSREPPRGGAAGEIGSVDCVFRRLHDPFPTDMTRDPVCIAGAAGIDPIRLIATGTSCPRFVVSLRHDSTDNPVRVPPRGSAPESEIDPERPPEEPREEPIPSAPFDFPTSRILVKSGVSRRSRTWLPTTESTQVEELSIMQIPSTTSWRFEQKPSLNRL